jgi:hypothetical protein
MPVDELFPVQQLFVQRLQESVRFLRLDGQFDDFTPTWYTDVGLSIMVLLMINILSPLINLAIDLTLKSMERCWLVRYKENASQVRVVDTCWVFHASELMWRYRHKCR